MIWKIVRILLSGKPSTYDFTRLTRMCFYKIDERLAIRSITALPQKKSHSDKITDISALSGVKSINRSLIEEAIENNVLWQIDTRKAKVTLTLVDAKGYYAYLIVEVYNPSGIFKGWRAELWYIQDGCFITKNSVDKTFTITLGAKRGSLNYETSLNKPYSVFIGLSKKKMSDNKLSGMKRLFIREKFRFWKEHRFSIPYVLYRVAPD